MDSSSPAAPALHEDIEVFKTVFKDADTGSPVPEYWSNICTKAFNNKLKKDKLSDLQKEYKPPENIKAFCKGPRLNSMIYRELPDYVRGKVRPSNVRFRLHPNVQTLNRTRIDIHWCITVFGLQQ